MIIEYQKQGGVPKLGKTFHSIDTYILILTISCINYQRCYDNLMKIKTLIRQAELLRNINDLEWTYTREVGKHGWTERIEFTLPVNQPKRRPKRVRGVKLCDTCGKLVKPKVKPETCNCSCHFPWVAPDATGTCKHCSPWIYAGTDLYLSSTGIGLRN